MQNVDGSSVGIAAWLSPGQTVYTGRRFAWARHVGNVVSGTGDATMGVMRQ
jgi:hypothetical protein